MWGSRWERAKPRQERASRPALGRRSGERLALLYRMLESFHRAIDRHRDGLIAACAELLEVLGKRGLGIFGAKLIDVLPAIIDIEFFHSVSPDPFWLASR